ncbi:MAG TPA: HAD-IB family phosphatase [Gemmata sp.]|nr:HAD-IB family phosphatase [Gemmata sp.]
MTPPHGETRGGVLVSDFDGTMTRHDFYKLAIASLLPADTPDYWAEYRTGSVTHFEALRRYFASIPAGEADVLAVVDGMELDPGLPAAVEALRREGWRVVVTSAGCEWYIRRLLAAAGVSVEVHANPGRFVAGRGLQMEMPADSPFLSRNLGIDKTAVVRRHLADGATVAFAGDGFPDAEPARLVPGELRFARGDLADVLEREGLPFHPFERWSDIARVLLERRV